MNIFKSLHLIFSVRQVDISVKSWVVREFSNTVPGMKLKHIKSNHNT